MKSLILAVIIAALFPISAGAVEFYTFASPCNLVLIDTSDGSATDLGPVLNSDPDFFGWSIEAMDFGPDGLLYATAENGCFTHGNANWLVTIDPATLAVSPIGLIDAGGIGIGDVDALAFSPVRGTVRDLGRVLSTDHDQPIYGRGKPRSAFLPTFRELFLAPSIFCRTAG